MSKDEQGGQAPRGKETPPPVVASDPQGYWRANRRLIGLLLLAWAGVSYGCSMLLVEWLNQFTIGGLPLGFWFAQQGAIFVFVGLIFIYAWTMDWLDRKYGVRQ